MGFLTLIKTHWFLFGIVFVIVFAHLWPNIGVAGGVLYPEYTVKYGAVSFIFFTSGLGLRTEDLTRAVTQIGLHFYIQFFSLLFVPCFIYSLVSLLKASPMDPWLLNGLLVVGSMPPPVSSAVILTKSVGGNEAGAIFNSALGSFLGIFVTPAWLLALLGSRGEVPFSVVFTQLSITVVVPLVIGQIVRQFYGASIKRLAPTFSKFSSATLLLIIYTTFCDTFSHDDIDIDELSLMSIVALVFILQCALLLFTFYCSSARLFGFSSADVVACLFCTTHKSLTLGIPILRIVYGGDPQLSALSLPLLIYHPMQILLGGFLVPSVRSWMHATDRQRLPMSRFRYI